MRLLDSKSDCRNAVPSLVSREQPGPLRGVISKRLRPISLLVGPRQHLRLSLQRKVVPGPSRHIKPPHTHHHLGSEAISRQQSWGQRAPGSRSSRDNCRSRASACYLSTRDSSQPQEARGRAQPKAAKG
eukprot:3915099-Rhodomonas_salina.1